MRVSATFLISLTLVATQCSSPNYSQTKVQQSHSYENTAEGLKQLLQDAVSNAKQDDAYAIADRVNQMAIPNAKDWFRTTYPPEKAADWTDQYQSDRIQNQLTLQRLFVQLADSDGEVLTRKLSDPADSDSNLLRAANRPFDIYMASWRKSGAPETAHDSGIGYFVFIDGAFRWLSLFQSPQSSSIGKAPPKLIYHPQPEYSEKARKQGIEGKVVVSLVVDIYGTPGQVRVFQSLNKELDEKAVEAVRNWKFEPAMKDGQPVAVHVNVEVNFKLHE